MKQVAGQLRLDLAQYRELEAFSKFGSDLDKTTQAQLRRGQTMMELLKQDQYAPLTVEKQVSVLYLGVGGFLDDIPVAQIHEFEAEFIKFMDSEGKDVLNTIKEKKELDQEIYESLDKYIKEFKTSFVAK